MSIEIDLAGRVALVTGAAKGMGLEIARALQGCGATVVLGDVDEAALAEVADVGETLRLDVADAAAVEAAIEDAEGRAGPLDLLVNNAGIASPRQGMPFVNQEPGDWDPVFAVNARGVFTVSRAVGRRMMERRRGSIVNIASIAGRANLSTVPAYATSKAAVVSLTQIMARDLAPYGIRVNAVCPGMVLTPFYLSQYEFAAARDAEVREMGPVAFFEQKAKRLIPLGRGQEPREIANAVAFLASDLASAITGQSLNVDGGLVFN
jgi:NAD(P)-dependent dehydrogenase (short-subunit alcohol dehydrogenase family)